MLTPSLFAAATLVDLVDTHHDADIRDADRLAAAVREVRPDVVIHLAAQPLRPDLILCSTATRTRQTLAPLAAVWSPAPPISLERGLYLASEDALLGRLRAVTGDAGGTHEPQQRKLPHPEIGRTGTAQRAAGGALPEELAGARLELLLQLAASAPRYEAVRSDYERVLRQRNALLKGGVRDADARTTLEVFDAQLARAGADLIRARLRAEQMHELSRPRRADSRHPWR